MDAQSSIESYLKDWAFTTVGEKSCRFKPAETIRHGSVFLKPAMYLDITELYCVEVLSKGLRNTDAALHWLRDATDIPADRREVKFRSLVNEESTDECFLLGKTINIPHKFLGFKKYQTVPWFLKLTGSPQT